MAADLPMGEGRISRVESFNAIVRGVVTLGLTGAYVYMAMTGQIGADAYTGTLGAVLTWWFVSRDRAERRGAINGTAASNGTTKPAPPP